MYLELRNGCKDCLKTGKIMRCEYREIKMLIYLKDYPHETPWMVRHRRSLPTAPRLRNPILPRAISPSISALSPQILIGSTSAVSISLNFPLFFLTSKKLAI